MRGFRLAALVLAFVSSLACAAEGLVVAKSPHKAKQTMDRLEAAAKARGLVIFARIDHAAGAAKIGRKLRPTELLIFGNPQGGTPLLECAQTVGSTCRSRPWSGRMNRARSGSATTIRNSSPSGTRPDNVRPCRACARRSPAWPSRRSHADARVGQQCVAFSGRGVRDSTALGARIGADCAADGGGRDSG